MNLSEWVLEFLYLCLSILFILPSCSDNTVTNNNDTKDASQDLGKKDTSSKTDLGDLDASEDLKKTKDVGTDSSQDVTQDQSDSGSGDVRVDLGDPFPGRPKGQCQQKLDCPVQPNADCGSIPGGSCLNCATQDSNCPEDAVCSQFGACVVECQSENDCAPGLRCTGAGRCAPQRCQQGVCPTPLFGCTASGLCERKNCEDDVTVCDPGTICLKSRCVLDR